MSHVYYMFITAGPTHKAVRGEEGEDGGRVLWDATSRGLCGLSPHIAANMQRGSLRKLRNATSRAGQRASDPVRPCTRFVGQRSGDFSAGICQRCSDFLTTFSL